MITIDSYYQASGSSPPREGHAPSGGPPPSKPPPLSPELVEDLTRFLTDAIIADIRQFPNLAELKAKHEPTVKSASGLDRTDPRARRGGLGKSTRRSIGTRMQERRSVDPPPGQLRGWYPKKVGGTSKALGARPLPLRKFGS